MTETVKANSTCFLVLGVLVTASLFGFMFEDWWVPALQGNPSTTMQNYNNQFQVTVHFDEPTLQRIDIEGKTFTLVNIKECAQQGVPGNPSLPECASNVLLPFGEEFVDVTIEYSEPVAIQLDHNVLPYQNEVPLCGQSDIPFVMNAQAYSSTDSCLKNKQEQATVGSMRGFNLLDVSLSPVDYVPAENKLYYHPEAIITIKLNKPEFATLGEKKSKKNRFLRYKNEDLEMLKRIAENPELLSSYSPQALKKLDNQIGFSGEESSLGEAFFDEPSDEYPGGLCDPSGNYDYVIITHENISNPSGNYTWNDLLVHRQSYSGLSGTLVTVQQIDAESAYWNGTATFNDSAAHVREFLKDAYTDWGTEYVLLGGDWQTSGYGYTERQMVPARIFTDRYEPHSYDTMPCDLYYSNLDGDWWYSSNSIWGGGRNGANDKYSELYVARLALYNEDQVSNAVEKIIWYDTYSNASWLNRATFMGGDLGWSSTSKDYMEELRVGDGSYSQYNGFEEWNANHPDHLIDTSARFYDEDYPTETDCIIDFKDHINLNGTNIINHLDHGSCYNTLSLGTAVSLNNTQYFFGYSSACLSGRFTPALSGATMFIPFYIDRGAVALKLNTGYGYGSSGSTSGSSHQQQKIFWNYFFDDEEGNLSEWTLGKAQAYEKDTFSAYIDSSSTKCYVWYSSNLFGDPAQLLRIDTNFTSPVLLSNESPSNQSTYVSPNITSLNVTMFDLEGATIEYNITTSPNIGFCSSSTSNGIVSCPVSGLNYFSNYSWLVTAYDGEYWTTENYVFSTDDLANNPPVVSNIPGGNIFEGGTFSQINLSDYVNDPDHSDPEISWNYSGNSELLVSINPSRIATITVPDSEWNGSEIITFTATDPEGLFDSDTATFNVIAVNDPPVVSNIPDQTINEGQNFTQINLDDYVTDVDNSDDQISWLYSGNIELTVSIVHKIATVTTPGPTWSGSEVITFTASDPGEETDSDDVTFTVSGTNESSAPSITNPNPSNGTEVSVNLNELSINIEDADSFNWSITTTPDICSCSDNADSNGTKTCSISGLDYSTSYSWQVNASDGENLTSTSFSFNTEDQSSQTPQITLVSPSSGSGTTDTTPTFRFTVNDPDNTSVSCTLVIDGTEKSTVLSTADGITETAITSTVLSYSAHSWFIRCTDGTHTSDSSIWSLTVSRPSSGGGGGSSGSSSSGGTPPKPKYVMVYNLSEIESDELENKIISSSVKKALLGAGLNMENQETLEELFATTKSVYKECETIMEVTHPDVLSTQIDVNVSCTEGLEVENIVVYVELPKSFAENAEDINVEMTPKATMSIIESDPIFSFYHEDLKMGEASYSFYTSTYLNRDTVASEWKQPWVFFGGFPKEVPITICGNNVVENEEQCDGSAPQGYTCTDECLLKQNTVPACENDGVCTYEEEGLLNCADCQLRCINDAFCEEHEKSLGCYDCEPKPHSELGMFIDPIRLWAGAMMFMADLVMIVILITMWNKKDWRKKA